MIIGDKQLIAKILKVVVGEDNDNIEIPTLGTINETSIIRIIAQEEGITSFSFDYPLDTEMLDSLKSLKDNLSPDSYSIYQKSEEVKKLWATLIEKAIKCLRYFDVREPFISSETRRNPIAYGINDLIKYYNAYDDFESLLYGSNKYYRDHLVHAFRTWLLGIYIMLLNDDSRDDIEDRVEGERVKLFIESIKIEGVENESTAISENINLFEKISIWTVIALCHDLGYPLEKSQQILNKTRVMMDYFIANPRIWSDISFSGVQDNINDYIIKFMSSKMVDAPNKEGETEQKYHGRIQPKYFIKFTKSLEKYNHGIISSLIIYKMLLYFIESDYNMNEDYLFDDKEKRQFYIRREILRSISAHTCEDIYHLRLTTFSALLINCDELQEWGRKRWSDFYTGSNEDNVSIEIEKFNPKEIHVKQTIKIKKNNDLRDNVFKQMYKQFEHYKTIFRDGQDTSKRKFDFKKDVLLECANKDGDDVEKYQIEFIINSNETAKFNININISQKKKKALIKEELNTLATNNRFENFNIN